MKKIKYPFWLLFSCVIMFLVFLGYFSGYRFNITDSSPFYVFRLVPLLPAEEINRHDFVAFRPARIQHDVIPLAIERQYINHRYLMVKEIAGIPGDTILLKSGEIFINGVPKSLAVLTKDSQQRNLSPYPTPLILEDGFYWLISDPERGFDSRYFGPVNRSLLLFRAFPVF